MLAYIYIYIWAFSGFRALDLLRMILVKEWRGFRDPAFGRLSRSPELSVSCFGMFVVQGLEFRV